MTEHQHKPPVSGPAPTTVPRVSAPPDERFLRPAPVEPLGGSEYGFQGSPNAPLDGVLVARRIKLTAE